MTITKVNVILVYSLLVIWPVSLNGVKTQLSIADHCEWNYTEKDTHGFELYRVFMQLLDSKDFKYPVTTLKRRPAFKIEISGRESDEKRKLLVSWETRVLENTVMISYHDLLDTESVLKRKYIHIRVENISPHIEQYRIRFDCLEVVRGLNIYLKACELALPERGNRRPPPACTGKTINTISCTCNTASVNVTGVALVQKGKPETKIKILYSNMLFGWKMSIAVKKVDEAKSEYTLEKLELGPYNNFIDVPHILKSHGNYTIQIRMFCQDYSELRVDQECQLMSFIVENRPILLTTRRNMGLLLTVFICFGVGILIFVGTICLIYKHRHQFMEILTSVLRRRDPYNPVSPESPSLPMNNVTSDPVQLRKCAVFSHYKTSADFDNSIEKPLIEHLKSARCSVNYSWGHRQLAIGNWNKLSADLTIDCTDIFILLSDLFLDLLELSKKQKKTESEKLQWKILYNQRLHENVPHQTLENLQSMNRSVGHQPVINVLTSSHSKNGSDIQRFKRIYPSLFPFYKVHCFPELLDSVPKDDIEGIKVVYDRKKRSTGTISKRNLESHFQK